MDKLFVAVAGATREGMDDPELFADWSELVDPVEFDVYDSDFPVCYSLEKAVAMAERHQRPTLGEGMFRYYLSRDEFGRKLNVCRQAAHIASGFKNQSFALETEILRSYIELAKCIYDVAGGDR